MEQITYNMVFRWFVGRAMDAPVWDVTVFTENCWSARLAAFQVSSRVIAAVSGVPGRADHAIATVPFSDYA